MKGTADHDKFGAGVFSGHPRGLLFILLCQAGFAFSITGMQAISVLYLSTYLFQPEHIGQIIGFAPVRTGLAHTFGATTPAELASVMFGLAGACAYLTPLIGGVVSDRLMTRAQAVLLGAALCAVGQLLVAVPATYLIGLAVLLTGIAFVGVNIATQLGDLYAQARGELSDAFQAIQIFGGLAAILGPIVCGALGQGIAWRWGFVAAAAGMLLGLAGYAAGLRYFPVDPGRTAIGTVSRPRLVRGDGKTVAALLGLLPALILAGLANGQINNAYLEWGGATYSLQAFGHTIPTSWLVALDSGFSVAASAAVLAFWQSWARRRVLPNDLTRIAIGAFVAAAAPVILALASAHAAVIGHRVSLGWAVAFHTFNSLGMAMVGPIAAAVFARMAPRAMAAVMMGILNADTFGTALAIGYLGTLLGHMSGAQFWLLHAGLVAAGGALIVLLRLATGSRLGGLRTPTVESPAAERVDQQPIGTPSSLTARS
jgi:POT family proton-dependent oligopeptide transporter